MELIKIGKALKTHGYKGHLRVFINEFYMDDFKEMKALFINNLPYFILSKDINTENQAIISLEEINAKEKAFLLQGKDIFANENDLTNILEEAPYSDLIGFIIEDETKGVIGEIETIIEMPKQYLAQLFIDKKEILIPLNDAFIIEINPENKSVKMNLPEGFLDVF